jgi:hypothetical protein
MTPITRMGTFPSDVSALYGERMRHRVRRRRIRRGERASGVLK